MDTFHVGDMVRIVPETGKVIKVTTSEAEGANGTESTTTVVVRNSDGKVKTVVLGNGTNLEKVTQKPQMGQKA